MTDLVQRLREHVRQANHAAVTDIRVDAAFDLVAMMDEVIAEIETLRAGISEMQRTRCGPECFADGEDPNCLLESQFQDDIEALRLERNLLQKISAERAGKIERLAKILDALADEAAQSVEFSDWPELQVLVGKAFGAVARDGQP